MKIIINATNITEDRPLREVDRLINKGLAHLPNIVTIELSPTAKELIKKYDNEFREPQITYEDLDGIASFTPKEEVTDIDPIEPIPTDKYVSFDEPKDSVIGGPKMFKKRILKAIRNKII